jgi:hypothetical protein
MRTTPHAPALLTACLALSLVAGCDEGDQISARQRVTDASCDYFAACMKIGSASGATYETRDTCEVQLAAHWENVLPKADCSGAVDEAALDLCLHAIDTARCDHAGDFLNVVLNRCTKQAICKMPTDMSVPASRSSSRR